MTAYAKRPSARANQKYTFVVTALTVNHHCIVGVFESRSLLFEKRTGGDLVSVRTLQDQLLSRSLPVKKRRVRLLTAFCRTFASPT
jgi:hypothetical protein